MKKQRGLLVALGLGLVLTLALLWFLNGSSVSVIAASVSSRAPESTNRSLGNATLIRYVAITGTDSGDCSTPANACLTVQYAVDQASEGDEIRVAAGTYTGVLSRSAPSDYYFSPVVTQMVYITKTVAILGGYTTTNWVVPDLDANLTTLDAERQGRVLFISGSISPTIEGLRIVNGNAEGMGGCFLLSGDAGGGVYVTNATPVISGNYIFGNIADCGGGLYLNYDAATLTENIIVSNTASGYGGGLYLSLSSATLNRNTFLYNIANDLGGGLLAHVSSPKLNGDVIISNTAGDGGGLYVYTWSSPTLNGCTISGNTATGRGGGLGIYCEANATLVNTIVANNQAHIAGSGVYLDGSWAKLLHTTIAHNTGGDGSGIHLAKGWCQLYGTFALTNTIMANQIVGITVTTGYSAILNTTLWHANTDNWGGAGTIDHANDYYGDPAFVDPQTGNYHIGSGSAAIDVGIDTDVSVDIDGEPRPCTGRDIGADEYPIALSVTKKAGHDPVQAGSQLTYTISVTNTGVMTLTAIITDALPDHVTTTQPLIWSPITITSGNLWTGAVVVTVEMDYVGPLTNVVSVTTEEGATGIYTETSTAITTPPNHAPYAPSNPIPADGATDVPITQTLLWQGGDPDGDLVTYTVAFGTSDPPPVVATVTLTNYAPGLITDTTYYWAITSSDGISTSVGPVWRFTTVGFKYIYLPLVLRNF